MLCATACYALPRALCLSRCAARRARRHALCFCRVSALRFEFLCASSLAFVALCRLLLAVSCVAKPKTAAAPPRFVCATNSDSRPSISGECYDKMTPPRSCSTIFTRAYGSTCLLALGELMFDCSCRSLVLEWRCLVVRVGFSPVAGFPFTPPIWKCRGFPPCLTSTFSFAQLPDGGPTTRACPVVCNFCLLFYRVAAR